MAETSSSVPRWISFGFIAGGVVMAVFGLAEIVTAFRHDFFGLSTSKALLSTILGAALGLAYVVSAALFTLRRYRAALAAAFLLGADVIGRIIMVLTGFYSMETVRQGVGIVLGTLIAAFFAAFAYLGGRRLHLLD